jgi:hypothetical protein
MKLLKYMIEYVLCIIFSSLVGYIFHLISSELNLDFGGDKTLVFIIFLFALPIGTQLSMLVSKQIIFKLNRILFVPFLLSIIVQIACFMLFIFFKMVYKINFDIYLMGLIEVTIGLITYNLIYFNRSRII